ncbi:MAG: 30S ribosomal protein S17 [bacterium]|nr:30S ribosomal protein S17 [bacterium]
MTTETTTTKLLKGIVVSDAMDKTVVVSVQRFQKHPKYHKFIQISKKYKAHDEENAFKVGDEVTIAPCPPLSKDKHFIVVTK